MTTWTTTDTATGLAVMIPNTGTGVPRPMPRTHVKPVYTPAPREKVVVKDQTTAITDVLVPLVQQMLALAESGRQPTPTQMEAFTARYVEALRQTEAFTANLEQIKGELEVAADVLRYIGGE